MIEAARLAYAFEAYNADKPAVPEPKPIESIQRVVVDTTTPERERCLITGKRYTTVVELEGYKSVFQFIVFDSRSDTAVKKAALDTPIVPEAIRQSKDEPIEIAILMGGSSDANGSVKTIPGLLRELYQPSDGKQPLEKPVRITLLSHPQGTPHEGRISLHSQSGSLLKSAYEQVASQAKLRQPEYLIGHSAGSLIAYLADSKSTVFEVEPATLTKNEYLMWKFLMIPWRELVRGKFKDENLLRAIIKSIALSKEALLSPEGEIGNFNPLREYSIGWFKPPRFTEKLGKQWGLRRMRGINPSIKLLSQRDPIFNNLEADQVFHFQQRCSEVVSLLARDPNGKRRSPRDLLLADRKELERELEKRVNQVLPRAEAKLLEGHHNEILTGPGPMREIAAIIRGDS